MTTDQSEMEMLKKRLEETSIDPVSFTAKAAP